MQVSNTQNAPGAQDASSTKRKARPMRPMPADFTQVAPGKQSRWLAKHYGAGRSTVLRWMDEAGIYEPRPFRAREGLPDNIETLAQTMCIHEIGKAVGWHKDIVAHQLKLLRPDIYAMAKANGLRKAYEGRMRGVAANKAKAAERQAAMPPKPKAAPRRNSVTARLVPIPMQTEARTDVSKAMRYLQRFGACYPRSVERKALHGYIFALKPGILSADDIIAEAKRRGWQPDAWRDLAVPATAHG